MLENIAIIPASLEDHPVIQNMARFYVYDLARVCGWPIDADGLYESFDFKPYFIDQDKKSFLIKISNELAGFVLLNKHKTGQDIDWNMGEFFIISKFQNKGYGSKIAQQIWRTHSGLWEISVIP
jgi:predicted acetyltransferase